jgi:predicted TIM-barrel fold metal-dependent hydrolase
MYSGEIIDAHQHLYNYENKYSHGWLSLKSHPWTGDWSMLANSYLIDDYIQDIKNQNVVKSVHVDAEWADQPGPWGETIWIDNISKKNGFPNSIVGHVNLYNNDSEHVINKHLESSDLFVGIRHNQFNHDKDKNFIFSEINYMQSEKWLENFKLLKKYDLSFDLACFYNQLFDGSDVAKANPDTVIILNHVGQPIKRDKEEFQRWKLGIKKIAENKNVNCKLSGVTMTDHNWTIASIEEVFDYVIDSFGIDRCLVASNFPVDKLFGSYDKIFNAYKKVLEKYSDEENNKLFSRNASKLYKIK